MPPILSVPYAKLIVLESKVLGVRTGYYELSLGTYEEVETIIWLHGSGTAVANQLTTAAWAYIKESIKYGMKAKSLKVIFPTCLPDLFWLNIANGVWKIEDYLYHEILPLANQASLANPSGRIQIHGYSMGGYAALRLGLRYSHLFKRVVAIAPGPLSTSLFQAQRGDSGIKKTIFRNVFGGSEDMYRRCSPYSIATSFSEDVKSNGLSVELVVAENDSPYVECNRFYRLLAGLGIDISLIESSGVGHRLDLYLDELSGRLL